MEICTHCGMYMKPFIHEGTVECEFCGEKIAEKIDGRWKPITSLEEIK